MLHISLLTYRSSGDREERVRLGYGVCSKIVRGKRVKLTRGLSRVGQNEISLAELL